MYLFTVRDRETADKVISWVKAGRGIRLWKSHDLGAGRPDVVTPGDSDKPHWAYPAYQDITLADIEYDEQHFLPIPPEWFEKCQKCNGTGLRTYADLAQVRNESIEQTKKACTHVIPHDEDHFVCTYCQGDKYDVKRFKIKIERKYWGGWEPVGGTKFGDGSWDPPAKVKSMLKKLSKHYGRTDILWDWGYPEEGNMAEVKFYHSRPVCLATLTE